MDKKDTNHSEKSKLIRNEETSADQEFRQLVGQHLEQWDETVTPSVPSIQALTQLAEEHRIFMRKKLWSDLVLFWIVSGILLSGLLMLIYQDIRLYVIVQVIMLVAALLFLVAERMHRKVREKWTS